MQVGEVCTREVIVVGRGESITAAAKLMRECYVGDVVVTEEQGGKLVPIGVLTDRDIVVELVAGEVQLASVTVGDAMSYDLLTVNEEDELMEALKNMRGRGVRRAPVVDRSGALVGVLAADDIVDLVAEQLSDVVALIVREQQRERRIRH